MNTSRPEGRFVSKTPRLWMAYRFWIVIVGVLGAFLTANQGFNPWGAIRLDYIVQDLVGSAILIGLPGAIFWAITGRKPWQA